MYPNIFSVSEGINRNFNSNEYFKKRQESLKIPPSRGREWRNLKKKIISGFLKYCELTTVQGLRYVAEPNRPLYDRVFWLLALALVYVGMIITISAQVKNYLSNPVLMSLSGELTSTSDIPFPAVSLCSENQLNPSLINFTEIINKRNRTSDDKMKLNLGIRVCKAHVESLISSKLNMVDEEILDAESNMKFAIKFGLIACRRTVKSMSWQSTKKADPCSYLQLYPSKVGNCFVFNMLPFTQLYTEEYVEDVKPKIFNELSNVPYKYFLSERVWDLSEGYKELSFSENVIPWRTPGVSYDNSVTFFLDFVSEDLNEDCVAAGHGFWVVIHNPAEPPSPYQTVAYAETDMTTVYKILPKLTTTAENLRHWTPEERGCYYSHERKLKLYHTYTLHNCYFECEAEMVYKQCKCSSSYVSHRKMSTPMCGLQQIACMQDVLLNFSSRQQESSHFDSCNCLPACTEIAYDIEYSDVPLNFDDSTTINSTKNSKIKGNFAVVTFLFKMNSVSNIQRVGIVTLSNFVANIGGLLGLFLGFSFVSLIEIVYFLTFRWATDLWNNLGIGKPKERRPLL